MIESSSLNAVSSTPNYHDSSIKNTDEKESTTATSVRNEDEIHSYNEDQSERITPKRCRSQRSRHPSENGSSLLSVPESQNENSSSSFKFNDYAATRQEKMIQAFGTMGAWEDNQEDMEMTLGDKRPTRIYTQNSAVVVSELTLNLEESLRGSFSKPHKKADFTTTAKTNSTSTMSNNIVGKSYNSRPSFEDGESANLQSCTTRSPLAPPKRSSLDRLKDLPSGSPGSDTSKRQSSSTVGSGISRLSFNSATSMPSLSSILEQDLNSIANTETSSVTTSLSFYSNHTAVSDGSSTAANFNSIGKASAGRNRVIPFTFDPPGNAMARDARISQSKVEDHLEGETVDCLGPTLSNKPKRLAQQRWESDAVSKTNRIAKVAPGNPNLAPLTHAQKMLLPPRQDVQLQIPPREDSKPVYAIRRESDTSSSTVTSINANKLPKPSREQEQEHPLLPSGAKVLGRLAEDSIPVAASRYTSSSSLLDIPP